MADQQHPETIPRYPLEWPLGWKRLQSSARRDGRFTKEKRPINVIDATRRLEDQLERLHVRAMTLSTNVSLRLDGRPRSDENPVDPGAAIYFVFKGKATVLACDTYRSVADNIAALAAHLEALRRIDRYGVGTIEQALAGYKALPADTAADWRMVLFGVKTAMVSVDDVQAAYRARAKELHPDIRHDDGAAMAHLNRARDYAIAELTH